MKKVSRTITHSILRWKKPDGTTGFLLDIPEITAKKVAVSMGITEYEYGKTDITYSLEVKDFINACPTVDYTSVTIY